MAVAFYDWQKSDFKNIDDPRFEDGVNSILEEAVLDHAEFWYEPEQYRIIQEVMRQPRDQRYRLIYSGIPLTTFIISENITPWTPLPNLHELELELGLRRQLQEAAAKADPHDPAWWPLLHYCDKIAVFIMYPLLRLQYPEMPIYLLSNKQHVTLANVDAATLRALVPDSKQLVGLKSQTRDIKGAVIFDLISTHIGQDLDFPLHRLKTPFFESIPETEMAAWYIRNYDPAHKFARSITKFFAQFQPTAEPWTTKVSGPDLPTLQF